MTESTTSSGLTPEQVDVFARGLYSLANIDGIHEREAALIREFLVETGSAIAFEHLADTAFNPIEAAQTLEASYLRRIFLKLAIALVKSDGTYSDAERHALGELADAFGLSNAEFGAIEQDAARARLE